MKKTLLIVLLFALFAGGCAHFGQAALPPRADFFVTTGDLATKDYQPIALVESRNMMCTPCGGTLEAAYSSIEASLKSEVIAKAKSLGANGIINLDYSATISAYGTTSVTIRGLAVKM